MTPLHKSMLLALTILLAQANGASAQEISKDNYDFVAEATSKELKEYMNFDGSRIASRDRPMVKSNVKLVPLADGESYKLITYYSCQQGLIGCRKYKSIDFNNKRVAIRFKFSSTDPSPSERSACAAVVLPLILDLLCTDNFAGNVYVPDHTFQQVKASLISENFTENVSSPKTGNITIHLQSEPASPTGYASLTFRPALKED